LQKGCPYYKQIRHRAANIRDPHEINFPGDCQQPLTILKESCPNNIQYKGTNCVQYLWRKLQEATDSLKYCTIGGSFPNFALKKEVHFLILLCQSKLPIVHLNLVRQSLYVRRLLYLSQNHLHSGRGNGCSTTSDDSNRRRAQDHEQGKKILIVTLVRL
jgi:hypothetical protein